ncbi:hypothetical protein ACH42_13305 [Endozoicomonas sp. (ex Bugula neritina AB1)]|nr:hypothetical protein ACH42_13305 [Endozoicomonas sp. (ex Bugula neritina AB1)]
MGLSALSTSSISQADEGFSPDFSMILDGHYKSSSSALSETEKGFGLGHTELSISAPVDDLFFGKLTGVVHQHDSKTEFELEEAFIQTLSTPMGLSIRAGRFLSNIGYLNSQHSHTDSFTDRPAAYRAMLGAHYYDDGARMEFLMPTDFYWTLGTEAFSGKKMQAPHFSNPESVGVYTAYTKVGGDIGDSQSWQAGLSYLHNRNGIAPVAAAHDHEDHDHHSHSHSHSHSHNAQFTAKHLYGADFVWKWAPDGNYKYQNIALSGEYLRAQKFTQAENTKKDYHDGWYLSGVYQFLPQWATGVRYGEFNGTTIHDDHTHDQKLKETELMISWSHSHFSTFRLQYTHQSGEGFDHINNNVITLQYIMSLGAHDAHQF